MEILGVSLAVLGAALAAGLAGAGSSIGVSTAGKTGAGLVAEILLNLEIFFCYPLYLDHKLFMGFWQLF